VPLGSDAIKGSFKCDIYNRAKGAENMATTLEINGSRYLKGIFRTVTIATFAIACWAGTAAAQTAEAVAAAINSYSSGTGSLTAVPDGNLITVTGEIVGATDQLTLDVSAEVTVLWQATFQGSVVVPGRLIRLTGSGKFEVTSQGRIEQTTTSGAILVPSGNSVTVIVSGGKVSAMAGSAISANNANGGVVVSGGTVSATSGGAIISRNITISQADPGTPTLITSGNTSSSDGTISVEGAAQLEITGGTVENTASGNAIRSSATAGSVRINGGTVRAATGRAIVNTNVGTINISQAAGATTLITSRNTSSTGGTIVLETNTGTANERLAITGGTVENTASGNAVRNTSNGSVRINGGTVRAAAGFAVSPNATNGLTIDGTAAVLAHGTAIANVVDRTDFVPADNGVVIALNYAAGGTYMGTQGLVSLPADIARWDIQNGQHGIAYTRNAHSGFIEVPGVTVSPSPAKPTVTATNLVYNGMEQWPGIAASGFYTISGDLSATDAGNYTAYVDLNSDSYEWENGTSDRLALPWSIAKIKITAPVVTATGLAYNGTEQSAGIAANAAYEITGDVLATNAGNYTAYVALNDKINYEWENGTNTDLTLPWSIVKGAGESAPDYTAPTLLRAELEQTLSDVDLPPGWAWDEDLATPVGGLGVNRWCAP
jgi:hypothetical protein